MQRTVSFCNKRTAGGVIVVDADNLDGYIDRCWYCCESGPGRVSAITGLPPVVVCGNCGVSNSDLTCSWDHDALTEAREWLVTCRVKLARNSGKTPEFPGGVVWAGGKRIRTAPSNT